MKRVFIVVFLLSPAARAEDASRSGIEASVTVPAEQDGCLNHAVKELGMSAKREGETRRWTIGPQFLHPSVVQGGALGLTLEAAPKETLVKVEASWPGAPKAADVQPELEERMRAIASKVAQICGVATPAVRCTRKPAGEKPADCAPAPAN